MAMQDFLIWLLLVILVCLCRVFSILETCELSLNFNILDKSLILLKITNLKYNISENPLWFSVLPAYCANSPWFINPCFEVEWVHFDRKSVELGFIRNISCQVLSWHHFYRDLHELAVTPKPSFWSRLSPFRSQNGWGRQLC